MKSKGAYLFNTRKDNISANIVRELYRNNLIECNCPDLMVIAIPVWAKDEASKYGIVFDEKHFHKDYSTESDESGIKAWNSYHYPALYQTIVNGVKNHVSESALAEW